MKTNVLLSAALLTASIAAGRTPQRFAFATSLGTVVAVSEPAATPLLWRVSGYYNAGRRFSFGIGTGLSLYEKALIPVFGDVRYALARPRRFTPYLQFQAGYAFAPARDAAGGLLLAPSVGVGYAVGGIRLFLAVGYESQRLERLKKYAGSRFSARFAERLRHQGIAVRIGVRF